MLRYELVLSYDPLCVSLVLVAFGLGGYTCFSKLCPKTKCYELVLSYDPLWVSLVLVAFGFGAYTCNNTCFSKLCPKTKCYELVLSYRLVLSWLRGISSCSRRAVIGLA
jgi:hypothetical protein